MAEDGRIRAEVLTPEGEVFGEEVEFVSTKTETGSIGILAGHQPLLAMLAPTTLELHRSRDSDVVRYAQGEGYVQVTGDRVLILVEEAVEPDALDSSDLQEKLREAERAVEETEEDSEARKKAERDVRRWRAFSEIAGGA